MSSSPVLDYLNPDLIEGGELSSRHVGLEIVQAEYEWGYLKHNMWMDWEGGPSGAGLRRRKSCDFVLVT